MPLVVAGDGPGRPASRRSSGRCSTSCRRTIRVVELAGADETFDWLPQASELGWPGVAPPVRAADGGRRSGRTRRVLLAAELSDHLPAYTWGEAARIAVRAASIGYGLAATIHADSLDDVFDAAAAAARPA